MDEVVLSWLGALGLMLNGSLGWYMYYRAKSRTKQQVITVVGAVLVTVCILVRVGVRVAYGM
ncbi:hypothetical protein B9G54_03775 [Alloscardovia macacae]|uniref:Uncharacterized protein n=1 Tax=Alloscardovia macacae TaxID=1160091 RepID=A0A1Y2T154_9BIFI|nr:hypothetical protein [Alloscardovia macacae]OTA26706.1 hypothetical protein B9G54_03775 [Alloscardovia macacae]OTA29572.1 hypothetical protein B9T39_02925 [Alloscardovia macacae]